MLDLGEAQCGGVIGVPGSVAILVFGCGFSSFVLDGAVGSLGAL